MLSFAHVSHGSYAGAPLPGWVLYGTGVLLLLALLVGTAGYTALEISPDNRRYRTYFGLLGLRLGAWQPLPPVVGVTLKLFSTMRTGATASTSSWGVWDTSHVRYQKLLVLLSLPDSTSGLVIGRFAGSELAAARTAAQVAAARFGVPVHEYLVPQRTRRR